MVSVSTLNTLKFDSGRCTGCGICIAVCPHGVFAMNRRIIHIVRPAACMECGACQMNCPFNAVSVESGVGCAAAMLRAALMRRQSVQC